MPLAGPDLQLPTTPLAVFLCLRPPDWQGRSFPLPLGVGDTIFITGTEGDTPASQGISETRVPSPLLRPSFWGAAFLHSG